MRIVLTSVLTAVLSVGIGVGEPSRPPLPEEEIVSRYLDASQTQQDVLRGGTEEMDIDASVVKLKKQGKLRVLKSITALGKISFRALGFSGDNTVKTEVIARYLKAEIDASEGGSGMSITPENYKFKYKGTDQWNSRPVYVLQVTPRQKKIGLFKGELWLDAETYMPVREAGAFVKTPSVFLKKMQFVREYELQNGVSVPQRLESRADVRFIGPVELNINFLSYSKLDQAGLALTSMLQQ